MVWFPAAGAVIGLCTGYGFYLFSLVLPMPPVLVLTLFLYILLTRGLHLDGFMDTIDGFFSHRSREDVLRIMKDPHTGSFAVLGAGLWFLLLVSTLPYLAVADFIIIHTLIRLGILFPALIFSYARESGTGKFFVEHIDIKTVTGAIVLTGVIITGTFYLTGLQPGRLIGYGAALMISVLLPLIIAWWSTGKIGGITGDVMGFALECCHIAIPVALLIANR